ncbi:MAG: hypothetical protein HUU56_06335 [Bdellovibrionaceae bacterium]|nr:hypothetical protein [Pseudobdellovibrionaceae bacterium]
MRILSILSLGFLLHAHADTSKTIKSCYSEYVNTMSKGGEESDLVKIRKKCLTKKFNKEWKKRVAASDSDAIVLSQDLLQSWEVALRIESIDAQNSIAKVILGNKQEEQCLLVSYVTEGKLQRISNVQLCSNK